MASIDELSRALVNADAAGDADAARALASEIRRMRDIASAAPTESAPMQPPPKDDGRNNLKGKIGAVLQGIADTGTFGYADEILAGLDAATGRRSFDDGLKFWRDKAKNDSERGGYMLGGQIGGGIAGGVGLAKAGLSAGYNAARAGEGLWGIAKGGALDGAVTGLLHGSGSGTDTESRATNAAVGAPVGLLTGAIAPFAVTGAAMAAKPLVAPIMSRLRPDQFAENAMGEALRRSGTTIDDAVDRMALARADGQDMFSVADALGNSGQRMLSTVARNPSDARQGVVEGLLSRQMDQGGRIASYLQDASGSPLTAGQYKTMLEAERGAAAAKNYAPVASDMNPIDVSGPVSRANAAISPAADRIAMLSRRMPTDLAARRGIESGEATINDPIRETVKEARSYLASPQSTVVNVEKAFRAKTNIDQQIATATEKGQGGRVAALMPVRDALDSLLAKHSPDYAKARDAYRVASEGIDAIDTGKAMAAPRARPADNLSTFGALPSEQAHSARVGYFDPLIARAENQAGQMSNSARPLITERTRQEFPALAAPGEAERLIRRIGREQRMFETSNAALGGSKTADNLADAADMTRFDPGVMSQLMRGKFLDAGIAAVTRGINEAQGNSAPVIERLAAMLMERQPEAARRVLEQAAIKKSGNEAQRALVASLLSRAATMPIAAR